MKTKIQGAISRFGYTETNTELENIRNKFLAYFFVALCLAHIALIVIDFFEDRMQFMVSHFVRIAALMASVRLLVRNKTVLAMHTSLIVFHITVLFNAFSLPEQSIDYLLLFPLMAGLFIVSKNFVFNLAYLIASVSLFITALYFQIHYQTLVFNIGHVVSIILLFCGFFTILSFFVYEFKHLSSQLHTKNLALGDAVEELSVQNKRLENSNEFNTQIMTVIAHDLKGQFNSLIGYASLLNNNFDHYDTAKNKLFIAQLLNSSQNGHTILENLLSWSQSHSGNIHISNTNTEVVALCKTIVREMELHGKQKNVDVTIDAKGEFPINTDATLLGSIIRNLLSNSIKFSHKDSSVLLSINKHNNLLSIGVRNYGYPIEADKLELIKNKQNHESTSGTLGEKGTGLGLIICHDFTELLGGTLSVDSTEKFTQFTLELPV